VGYTSSNHPVTTAQEATDRTSAREIAELKKRADLFQTRAEKMAIENAGLRELQKSWEKEKKSKKKWTR
jgi:phosphate uptake regulator